MFIEIEENTKIKQLQQITMMTTRQDKTAKKFLSLGKSLTDAVKLQTKI